MKKLLFLLSFCFAVGIASADAQCTASKACCANKAAKAASVDATIEKRMADDGTVSYVRKEADAQGNVKFVSVQFDEASNAFVNVAPKTMSADAKAGTTVKKSCAAAGSGKACCAGKSAATTCTDKKEQ